MGLGLGFSCTILVYQTKTDGGRMTTNTTNNSKQTQLHAPRRRQDPAATTRTVLGLAMLSVDGWIGLDWVEWGNWMMCSAWVVSLV